MTDAVPPPAVRSAARCRRHRHRSCWRRAPRTPRRTRGHPAGKYAQDIHDLQWPIFMIAGIVGVIVFVVVGVCVVKFNDRGQPIPEQSHGNALIEYSSIACPAVLLAVDRRPHRRGVIDLNDTDNAECVVNVTGQQWWWEYDYPIDADGNICGFTPTGEAAPIVTSGQMIIPTEAKVVIRGTSRDVIHSFWVPRLNGKRDMVPGRVHTWNFEAEPAGHLRRAVRRVLRALARQHAHGDRRARRRRLPGMDRQPARAVPVARSGHAGRRPARRPSSPSAHVVTRSTVSPTPTATSIIAQPENSSCGAAPPRT